MNPASKGSRALMTSLAAAAIFAPMDPAEAQSVSDRILSDVRSESSGQCTVLTVNFNIRLQVLSFFPQTSGRELHVRLKPLDGERLGRESLRTPSGVPALRSIEFEGDNASGPVLSLSFTKDMRFTVAAGAQPQTIVISLAEPRSGPICPTADETAVSTATPSPAQSDKPAIPIPSGLYVVNVLSQPKDIGQLPPQQLDLLESMIAYETRFERDAETWHRLRVGFFDTREQAEAAKARLAKRFPAAWVTKVSAQERAQGVSSRIETGSGTVAPTSISTSAQPASDTEVAETAKLIQEAETAIKAGENDRAVQLLTNALALPENDNTPRSLELLGLTRERKGQNAHAQAEYEEYLRRYPQGEAAERVRQRLAALNAPAGTATPELRQASGKSGSATEWSWGLRGSFSQFYFRDQSTTRFVDATAPEINAEVDNSVNLNQLLTTGDVTISGGNDRNQFQMRAAGSFSKDFRSNGRDIRSLTALYFDYNNSDLKSSIRIGRQTRNSAGVLGRFDGVLMGFQARKGMKVNLVAGFPVLTSRQTHILKDRKFYGASVDLGGKGNKIQTTLYWFDQYSKGGFSDRRAIGMEARYFTPKFNAYSILDYDVKYKRLNLGLLTLNYNFPDTSALSLTADYRQSPLLTTNNALIGQVDPVTFASITDLRGLRPFFTDPQIYQLAKDRTLVAKSLTLSYSRPISKKLQANFDVTATHSGGTPASGGVMAQPSTGTEYYYGAQLVGSGMIWANDIYILSGRFADTQRARTYTADVTARVPVTKKFRLSPRARYGYRDEKLSPGTFRQFQPTMRINYYPVRHSEIEIEFGGNFSKQRSFFGGTATRFSESGYVLNIGYRLDF